MTPQARVAAAIDVLDHILNGMPAEKALTGWARRSRFAGSKDRAAVRDHVFDVLRHRRSFAAFGGANTGRGLMIGALRAAPDTDPADFFTGIGHAPSPLGDDDSPAGTPTPGAQELDLPDWVWDMLLRDWGPDKAREIGLVLQNRAPVTLRVNLRKIDRNTAIEKLQEEGIVTKENPISPTALLVCDGARKVAQSECYKTGLVELQDGASQSIVDQLDLSSCGKIMDFCAGGGGKTLAMAAQSNARFWAHDVNFNRMKDLPERAGRAGVKVNLLTTDQIAQNAPFDLVFCDVPCSGSGAWRRSPEGKWALADKRLTELNNIQDDILNEAYKLVAPDGVLAYATCSVFNSENQDRVERFLALNPTWTMAHQQQWSPSAEGDGFFLATLTRK